jgi:outer membrane protein assembly factor BamB
MFVAGGLLWGGLTPDMETGRIPREESPHAGKPLGGRLVQGLDLKTGEVKRELDIRKLITPGHHVRCYRAKATERFLMWPKRGVEFVDIVDGTNHERCNWFRGECSYGVIPANGLVYAPPHPCQCFLGVVLTGFNALAAKRPDPAVPGGPRLIRGPAYDEVKATDHREGDWPVYRHDATRSGRTASPVAVPLRECWAADIGGRLTPVVVSGGVAYLASIDRHTLYSLNAADGRILWTFTAGGRIDSPPSVYRGRIMFGCRDGRVYCLRATDGLLAWRFRAAPYARRIMAFGQLESPWPVSGSLLIVRDRIYFAAGRSSFLDGGVHLYALAPETGEVLRHHLFDGPWDDIEREAGAPYHMNGVKADLLTSDGTSIFLSFQEFDLDLNRRPLPAADGQGDRTVRRHLMPRNGFLDTAWFDRNSWSYGKRWLGRHFRPGVPGTGQIMSFDETTTYSVQVFSRRFFMSPRFVPGTGYLLRADVADGKGKPRFAVRVPIRARGMVMAGETLFLAGAPDVPGGEAFYPALTGPAEMWAISAKDGRKLSGLALDAAPVFDGLAVAGGRVFVPLVDGTLRCLTPQP